MNARDGLLDAIRADSEADEPRLILADWLEDHGQAERGELIRLQVVLSRLSEHHEARPEIEARVRGLLLLHQPKWVDAPGGEWQFRRGFAESLNVTSRLLLQRPELFLGSGLVRELRVQLTEPHHLALLTNEPGLSQVRSLTLAGERIGRRGLESLFDSPHTAGLTSLTLRIRTLTRRVLRELQHGLDRLKSLDLAFCGLSEDDLITLLPTESCQVERLCLDHNQMTGGAVVRLLQCRHFCHLRDLSLCGMNLQPEIYQPLIRAPFAASLERLNLSGNDRLNGLPLLVASRALPSLRYLDLNHCGANWDAPPLPIPTTPSSLRHLVLGWHGVVPDRLPELLSLPILGGLQTLEISGRFDFNPLMSHTLNWVLGSAPSLANLRTLKVDYHQTGAEVMRRATTLPLLALLDEAKQ